MHMHAGTFVIRHRRGTCTCADICLTLVQKLRVFGVSVRVSVRVTVTSRVRGTVWVGDRLRVTPWVGS